MKFESNPFQPQTITELATRIREIPSVINRTRNSSEALRLAKEQARLIQMLVEKTE